MWRWVTFGVGVAVAMALSTAPSLDRTASAARSRAQINDICAQIPGLLAAVEYTQGSWPVPDVTAVSADVAMKLSFFAEAVRTDQRWCDRNALRENPETVAGTLSWHFGNASEELRAYQAATAGVPPVAAPPMPPGSVRLQGVGQTATQQFALKAGLATFSLQHNGNRNFIVWLLNDKGERQDLLVNVIGPFSGSKAIQVRADGSYLLDVAADGRWVVSVTQ